MGRYVGDGWQRKTYSQQKSYRGGIVICCSKTKIEDYITLKNALDDCGLKFTETEERTVKRLSVYSVELYEFVERYAKTAIGKIVDGDTLNLPVELLEKFVDGYRDSDGTFTEDKFKLTSISRNLIYSTAQAIAKVYHIHYHIYHAKMPKTHIIEGRVVNQHDQYQLVWDTVKDKPYKAFFENGYIWFPVNKIKKCYKRTPITLYQLSVEGESYNAYSVITK